jgi:hypothetical protein
MALKELGARYFGVARLGSSDFSNQMRRYRKTDTQCYMLTKNR